MFKVKCINTENPFFKINQIYTAYREDNIFYYIKEWQDIKSDEGRFYKWRFTKVINSSKRIN